MTSGLRGDAVTPKADIRKESDMSDENCTSVNTNSIDGGPHLNIIRHF